jgi:hypothetical protein
MAKTSEGNRAIMKRLVEEGSVMKTKIAGAVGC